MKIGIIDIGSSTVKLNIVSFRRSGKSYKLLNKDSQTTKLAEGMREKENTLQDEPMARTVNCVKDFIDGNLDVNKWQVFSTSAARKATNINVFKSFILAETGKVLRVITQEEEARIFFMGVVDDFKEGYDFVAINVGGGSTEVTYGNKKDIYSAKSLPIGVVTLNETSLKSDPPTDQEYKELENYINKSLDGNIPSISNGLKKPIFLHTGGELTYIRRVNCPVQKIDLSKSHPVKVDIDKFKKFAMDMRKKNLKELFKFFPENPVWMSGAIASNAIAIAIAEKLGVGFFVPSDKNLSDGLILEMMNS